MHPADARKLALRLMTRHGLHTWKFRFDRATRRFGCCMPAARTITLSRSLTLLNGPDEVRDTILHEIAHALTPRDGHGPKWRQMCLRIGARPQRCFSSDTVKMPSQRPCQYEMGCTHCDWWADRRRLTPSRYRCKYCSGPIVYREKKSRTIFLVNRRLAIQPA